MITVSLPLLVILLLTCLPVIQHLSLRIVMWLFGYAPLNYDRFLNYACDRLFLQPMGGSYRFLHRSLQEYFVKIYEQGNGN